MCDPHSDWCTAPFYLHVKWMESSRRRPHQQIYKEQSCTFILSSHHGNRQFEGGVMSKVAILKLSRMTTSLDLGLCIGRHLRYTVMYCVCFFMLESGKHNFVLCKHVHIHKGSYQNSEEKMEEGLGIIIILLPCWCQQGIK